jgi:hypothetical protein
LNEESQNEGQKVGDVFGEFPEVSSSDCEIFGTCHAVNKSQRKGGTLWVLKHTGETLRAGVRFLVKLRRSIKPGAHENNGLVCERVREGNSADALAWGCRS